MQDRADHYYIVVSPVVLMSYGDGIELISPAKTRSGYLAEVRKMPGAYPEF